MMAQSKVRTILGLIASLEAAVLGSAATCASAADLEGVQQLAQANDSGDESAPGDGTAAGGDDLQKKLQNPVASVVSVPFQDNVGFGVAPFNQTQNVLLVQPVVPIPLTPDWNYIVRPILPVLAVPTGQMSSAGGLGDTVVQTFLSPSHPGKLIWGFGPNLQAPTGTNGLTLRQWGLGPSFVALMQPGHLTVGVLIAQTWGIGGQPHGAPYLDSFTLQPVAAYSFPHGWTVSYSTPWTANWSAQGEQWTIPVGLQVNKLMRIPHSLPVQLSLGAFDNVVRAAGQPSWFLRLQAQLILPPFWKNPWFGER